MGLIKRLPVRLLKGKAVSKKRILSSIGNKKRRVEADENDSSDDEVDDNPLAWSRKNPDKIGKQIGSYKKPELSDADNEILNSASSALDYYLLYSTPEYLKDLIHQSTLYAVQKHLYQEMSHLNSDTLRCVEATLLHSGYNQLPRRRMLWEVKPDCHNKLVSDSIRRTEVDAVLKCLHFRDNCKIDSDGYYKIRPIFDQLNSCAKWATHLSECGNYSVDEIMLPYFGRHSTKQYIRNKPVRYGFKVI